jgi:formate transporter
MGRRARILIGFRRQTVFQSSGPALRLTESTLGTSIASGWAVNERAVGKHLEPGSARSADAIGSALPGTIGLKPGEAASNFIAKPKGIVMSYLAPSEFVTKMIDAGESKVLMSTRDTVIRAYMAGAILALAAWFAVTINVNTGQPIIGALLFPVGFSMLYLLGFDLLTGVFVLSPLALIDKRPGVTLGGVLRNWGLVFIGNFAGALTVAFMMAFVTTFGFTQPPDKVGATIGNIGESRTLGYAAHGATGMATLFLRGMLCNWMVSTGVVGAMISTTVPGKVIAMWMPILVFFYMVFEHSVVNMFLFPSGLMLNAKFSIMDYFIWNEIPTVVGNLVGGLAFTGLTLYTTHVRTLPKREMQPKAATKRAAAA